MNKKSTQTKVKKRKDEKPKTGAPVALAACSSLIALAACDAQGNLDEDAFMGAMLIGGIASEISGNPVNWDAFNTTGTSSAGYTQPNTSGIVSCGCDGSNCGPGSGSIQ
ncbi:hypothetical protein [Yoonia sp. R78084]|uniref:hypothetical protein n=1 Tax=Yoonia sp. R78084 TaxID=3093869 RepID=UPI0037DCD593